MQEIWLDPWDKIPWRRAWQLTPVILPEEFHRQRRLVGYGPWGLKKLDSTKVTEHISLVTLVTKQ